MKEYASPIPKPSALFQKSKNISQIKVVQHYQPGELLQEIKRMKVKSRVTDMIKDAVVSVRMALEPGDVANGATAPETCDARSILNSNNINIVMRTERWQELRTVIRDASFVGWDRGYVSEARACIARCDN